MGLDLWFRQDVARILAATWEAMQATAANTRQATLTSSEGGFATAYQRGFEDALRAVGVAFGVADSGSRVPTAGQPLADRHSQRWIEHPPTGTVTELD